MSGVSAICIFYFTGTGNSGKVTEWISQEAKARDIQVTSYNLSEIERTSKSISTLISTYTSTSNLILSLKDLSPRRDRGRLQPYFLFIAPTHGFNYAPIMMHFLMRFPKGSNQVGLINTRAGMRIGKVITPGLSGLALLFGALVLRIKGYAIRAMIPVDLPSNWVSVHPNIRQEGVKIIHRKNKERVIKFADKILNGECVLRGLRDIVQDLLISPISIGYYFLGRYVLAKTFFASPDCTQCGLCEKACGVNAIKMVDGRPFWTHKCESCMHCMSHCQANAIQTGHGFVAVITILFTFIILGQFYNFLEGNLFEIHNHTLKFIISNGLYVIYIIIGYWLMHWLMHFKWIGRIIEFTSLTRYKFWGKGYKALKDEDFS